MGLFLLGILMMLNHRKLSLRKKRKSEVEILLSVFDQSNREKDHHILNIKEEDYPESFRPLIHRLQKAVSNKDVRDHMTIEDEIIDELKDKERIIAAKDEVIAEKDGQLEENREQIAEQVEQITEQKEQLAEKDRMIAELLKKLEEKP